MQMYYARTQEQQNLFPTGKALRLVASAKYTYDKHGNPSQPLTDACTVLLLHCQVMKRNIGRLVLVLLRHDLIRFGALGMLRCTITRYPGNDKDL